MAQIPNQAHDDFSRPVTPHRQLLWVYMMVYSAAWMLLVTSSVDAEVTNNVILALRVNLFTPF